MRTHSIIRLVAGAAALAAIVATGCNGGTTATTRVMLSIYWAERSRVVNAPSSALSAVITLLGRNPGGGDFTFTVNRAADPGAYLAGYESPNRALIGDAVCRVDFHANQDGQGDLVGVAIAQVAIRRDGTGIGNISTEGAVSFVEVLSGQSVRVGESRELIFSARNQQGETLALTPGSAFWSVLAGAEFLAFQKGMAVGLSRGVARVTATVDGVASQPAEVQVLATGRMILLGSLPNPPDDWVSLANDISGDGKAVVGASTIQGSTPGGAHRIEAFVWTEAGGMVGLGHLPGPGMNEASEAYGVNADGTVVVGYSGTSETNPVKSRRAFRWTQAGGMQDLGKLPGGGDTSYAYACSADGSVVVGVSDSANGPQAFIWTEQEGMIGLRDFLPNNPPFNSAAHGISADGQAIVGKARYDLANPTKTVAFIHRRSSGMFPLGFLNQTVGNSRALAANADGSVVVGASNITFEAAFRWTPVLGMADIAGGALSVAYGVSADGSVIVGNTDYDTGSPFIWDTINGYQNLFGYMVVLGIQRPPDFNVSSANGVSADGRSIVGQAFPTMGNGRPQAYLLELP